MLHGQSYAVIYYLVLGWFMRRKKWSLSQNLRKQTWSAFGERFDRNFQLWKSNCQWQCRSFELLKSLEEIRSSFNFCIFHLHVGYLSQFFTAFFSFDQFWLSSLRWYPRKQIKLQKIAPNGRCCHLSDRGDREFCDGERREHVQTTSFRGRAHTAVAQTASIVWRTPWRHVVSPATRRVISR